MGAADLLLATAGVTAPATLQGALDAVTVPQTLGALVAGLAVLQAADRLRPPGGWSPAATALAAGLGPLSLDVARDVALAVTTHVLALGIVLPLPGLALAGVVDRPAGPRPPQRRLDPTGVLLSVLALGSVLLPVAVGHVGAGPPGPPPVSFAALWPSGAALLYGGVGAGVLLVLTGLVLLRPPLTGRRPFPGLGLLAAAVGAGLVLGLPPQVGRCSCRARPASVGSGGPRSSCVPDRAPASRPSAARGWASR